MQALFFLLHNPNYQSVASYVTDEANHDRNVRFFLLGAITSMRACRC